MEYHSHSPLPKKISHEYSKIHSKYRLNTYKTIDTKFSNSSAKAIKIRRILDDVKKIKNTTCPIKTEVGYNSKNDFTSPLLIDNSKHLTINLQTDYELKESTNQNNKILNNLLNEIDYTDEGEKNYDSEIKKLNYWDIQNILTKQDPKRKSESKLTVISSARQGESINWLNDLKGDLRKLNLNKINPQIQSFYHKLDLDQKTIILHNINTSKKKFNFEVLNNDTHINKIQEFSILKINKKRETKFDRDDDNLPNIIEKIKNDENYNLISNIDYYRSVIQEKSKKENDFRKEIMKMSHLYYQKKVEKSQIEKKKYDILEYINKLRNEIQHKQMIFDDEKKELQKKNDFLTNKKKKSTQNIIEVLNTVGSSNDMSLSSHKHKSQYLMVNNNNFAKQSELLKSINKLENELQQSSSEYENKKRKCESQVQKLVDKIQTLEMEVKILKNNINTLIKDQKNYYLDLLKKGIDVRTEGLSWVIKRLIEININLENSHFPRFFDANHIDYLLKISYKSIETNQLKIILKTLKSRQKKLRENDNDKMIATAKTSFNEYAFDFVIAQPNSMGNKQTNSSFSERIAHIFQNIFKKYEQISKSTYESKIENFCIEKITEELKLKIKQFSESEGVFNFDDEKDDDYLKSSSGLSNYFSEINKNKSYFDEILLLRQAIQINENAMEELRIEEIKTFKKRYESLRFTKESINCDILYSALFGNGILI